MLPGPSAIALSVMDSGRNLGNGDAALAAAGNQPLLGHSAVEEDASTAKLRLKLSSSFFLLGLLNNVLYVIILSAALDLVPADVPKGIILFVNIFPALCVKLGWPYFIPGRVRYGRRVIGCSLVSFLGILLVAVSNGLTMRLIGIALASFSSGLGEMTFLQRSTVYGDDDIARLAVGWFSSGTGAAGLVGAALWWELRNLGVKAGLGISSILPVCMAASYFLLLPKSSAFRTASKGTLDHRYIPVAAVEEQPDGTSSADSRRRPQNGREEVAYDVDDDEVDDTAPVSPGIMPESMALTKPRLSPSEKLKLARPLFLPFMIPLFVVYFAEYTVNTGVSPTLLYPIPDKQEHPILARIIHKLSDYYPLWQLVYQTFVFFSRSSSVIFRVPPLPRKLVALPSALQFVVLLVALSESMHQIFTRTFGPSYAISACFLLIASEGLFGGLAYVNAYLRVGLIDENDDDGDDFDGHGKDPLNEKEILARREFRIACVGFADTLGIVAASLLSSWLEPTLCRYQVDHGRNLCREVKPA